MLSLAVENNKGLSGWVSVSPKSLRRMGVFYRHLQPQDSVAIHFNFRDTQVNAARKVASKAPSDAAAG